MSLSILSVTVDGVVGVGLKTSESENVLDVGFEGLGRALILEVLSGRSVGRAGIGLAVDGGGGSDGGVDVDAVAGSSETEGKVEFSGGYTMRREDGAYGPGWRWSA